MCVWCENAKKNHMRTSAFYFQPIVAKQCYCYRCSKAELNILYLKHYILLLFRKCDTLTCTKSNIFSSHSSRSFQNEQRTRVGQLLVMHIAQKTGSITATYYKAKGCGSIHEISQRNKC